MAMVPNRPARMMRRVAGWSLAADVAVGLLVALLISPVIGLVLFIIGLALIGGFVYNFMQVLKNTGRSWR